MTASRVVDTVTIVDLANAVERHADGKLFLEEEIDGLRREMTAVGLDGKLQPAPRIACRRFCERDERANQIDRHQRLAAVENDLENGTSAVQGIDNRPPCDLLRHAVRVRRSPIVITVAACQVAVADQLENQRIELPVGAGAAPLTSASSRTVQNQAAIAKAIEESGRLGISVAV